MSLTKEDLKALSDLIDNKLEVQSQMIDKRFEAIDKRFEAIDKRFEAIDKRFDCIDKKFEEQRLEFKDMLIDNNLLIAEHIQIIVSQSEERISKEIKDIRRVTADNCYNIVDLRNKIS